MARKGSQRNKDRAKRERKRRSDRARLESEKRLKERVESSSPIDVVVMGPKPGTVKMSVLMEEFVEPFLEGVESLEAYQSLVGVAACAWNVALLPEEEREAALNDLVRKVPFWERRATRSAIRELMERKLYLFPQHRRMILDYEVVDTPRGWHLSVVSSMDPV